MGGGNKAEFLRAGVGVPASGEESQIFRGRRRCDVVFAVQRKERMGKRDFGC